VNVKLEQLAPTTTLVDRERDFMIVAFCAIDPAVTEVVDCGRELLVTLLQPIVRVFGIAPN
jgi:hypothetical protein